MVAQKQVHDYILTALNYPLEDKEHLVRMVILHFDIDYDNASQMVDKEVQLLRYDPFRNTGYY